jgi:hypothetical protein
MTQDAFFNDADETSTPPRFGYGLHTHWDREWYALHETYRLRLVEVLQAILEGLDAGHFPKFCLDGQSSLIEDACQLMPSLKAQVAKACQQGKLHVGPWFTMPDTLLPSAEALIANLKLGIAQAEALGCKQFTGYLPDTFGHAFALPTLLRGMGLRHAVIWRGRRLSDTGSPYFWWQGPDGSTVLAYQLPEGYFQNQLHEPDASLEQQVEAALLALENGLTWHKKTGSGPSWLPIGGDHLGVPSASSLAQLVAAHPEAPFWFPHELMQAAERQIDQLALPLTQAPLLDWGANAPTENNPQDERPVEAPFLLSGCASARLWLKQWNRQLEDELSWKLEPALALAEKHGLRLALPWPAVLADSWKQLLLNDAHDSICGCSLDGVHRVNETRYEAVAAQLNGLWQRLRKGFLHTFQQNEVQQQVLLLHLEQVSLAAGQVLPIELRLPAEVMPPQGQDLQWEQPEAALFSRYETHWQDVPMSNMLETVWRGWLRLQEPLVPYSVSALPLNSLSKSTVMKPENVALHLFEGTQAFTLENACLLIAMDADGTLLATDKQTQVNYPLNHTLRFSKDTGDAYNRVPHPQEPDSVLQYQGFTVREQGALVCELELFYTEVGERGTPLHHVFVTLSLWANEAMLRFEAKWQQLTPNTLLTIAFNSLQPVLETQLDEHLGLRIQTHRSTKGAQRWQGFPVEAGQHEWQPEGGCFQHAVAWQNQALISLDSPAYEVAGHELHLLLHRGFSALSGGVLPSRGIPAGPPFATPEGQGLHRNHTRRYAWLPLNAAQPKETLSIAIKRFRGVSEAFAASYAGESTYQPVAFKRLPNLGNKPFALGVPQWPLFPKGVFYSAIRWQTPNADLKNWGFASNTEGLLLRLVNKSDVHQPLCLSRFVASGEWVLTLNLLDKPLAKLQAPYSVMLPAHGLLTLWLPAALRF